MRLLFRAFMAIVIPLVVVGAVLMTLRALMTPHPPEPAGRGTVEVAAATPSQTPTPTPTLTPPATPPPPTATPLAMATPQSTSTPTIEPTATRSPTVTPEPTPTVRPTPTEIPATYGEVASYRLNLRSGPGAGYETKQTLIQGDRLKAIAKAANGIWLQVIAPDGTEGWVNASYVDLPQALIEALPVAEPPPSG